MKRSGARREQTKGMPHIGHSMHRPYNIDIDSFKRSPRNANVISLSAHLALHQVMFLITLIHYYMYSLGGLRKGIIADLISALRSQITISGAFYFYLIIIMPMLNSCLCGSQIDQLDKKQRQFCSRASSPSNLKQDIN